MVGKAFSRERLIQQSLRAIQRLVRGLVPHQHVSELVAHNVVRIGPELLLKERAQLGQLL